jgi:hypothetical protein
MGEEEHLYIPKCVTNPLWERKSDEDNPAETSILCIFEAFIAKIRKEAKGSNEEGVAVSLESRQVEYMGF